MATPTGDRIDSEAPHQPGVSYSFPKRKFGKKQEVLGGFKGADLLNGIGSTTARLRIQFYASPAGKQNRKVS